MPNGKPLTAKQFWARGKRNKSTRKINGKRCLEWTGAMTGRSRDRGMLTIDRKNWIAPRYAFYLVHGYVPSLPRVVAHKCDNPKCIEPKHLENITKKQNTRDAYSRGLMTNLTARQKTRLDRYSEIIHRAEKQKARVDAITAVYGSLNSLRLTAKQFKISPSSVSRIVNGNRSLKYKLLV